MNVINKKSVRLVSCGVLVIYTVMIFTVGDKLLSLRYVLSGNNPYSEFGDDWYPFGAALRFGCYILSSVTGFAVLSVMPNVRIPVFTNIGAKTLTVYSLHRQILYVLQYTVIVPLMAKLSDVSMVLIFVAGSVLISVVLSLKPFEYILYPCIKCNKWINPIINWFKK